MKITIVVITLNPASEQVQELLNLLAKQNLKAVVTMGVDGRKGFPPLEDSEKMDQNTALNKQLIELTASEVGCYLSHFRTIKNAYSENWERICILEDDVLIEPDFKEVLDAIEKLPDEFEHVRLMGLKRHKRKSLFKMGKHHQLTRPVKGLCGTQGYVLNRRGMEKIIRQGNDITKPIDKFYDHFWEIDLQSYCVEPHIIWERPIIRSSILKLSRGKAAKPIAKRLRKHAIKLQRGFKRRIYIMKHWNDFFPAKNSTGTIGKTARIR